MIMAYFDCRTGYSQGYVTKPFAEVMIANLLRRTYLTKTKSFQPICRTTCTYPYPGGVSAMPIGICSIVGDEPQDAPIT